jgi:hypothetical protein
MKTRIKTTEKSLHKAVCQYLKMQFPHVMFNSDMSGIKLTMGQSVQAKSLRSNQGFPDIIIYEARKRYYGLFIELKREGERIYKRDGSPVTPHIQEQYDCIKALRHRGYFADFAVGFDEAKIIIDTYLRDDQA